MGWAFLFCAEFVCRYQHKAQQQLEPCISSPSYLYSEHYSANSVPYFILLFYFFSLSLISLLTMSKTNKYQPAIGQL
jgi:hypothetical protein